MKHLNVSQHEPIAWSQLEDMGSVDIADLMTQHYGKEEALQVALVILDKIPCCELVRRLKMDIGKRKIREKI